jgi:hypothetical protein
MPQEKIKKLNQRQKFKLKLDLLEKFAKNQKVFFKEFDKNEFQVGDTINFNVKYKLG